MSVIGAVLSGVVATLFLDIWQRLLKAFAGIPPSNWALVGRWFVAAGRGRFFHASIGDEPEAANELAIGWIGHYAVGIVYGFVYLAVIIWLLGSAPGLLNGLVFGALSVVVPWFFFMPAMGAGVMGSKTPDPKKASLLAFLAHCVFGVGLAVGAMLV